MYVYYYRTYEKAVSGGGEREKGGHGKSKFLDDRKKQIFGLVCAILPTAENLLFPVV